MVEKTIELTGISANSVEDAVQLAISRAGVTIKGIHTAHRRGYRRDGGSKQGGTLEGENQSDFPGERRASRVNESARATRHANKATERKDASHAKPTA